jgi:YaaC-like protein
MKPLESGLAHERTISGVTAAGQRHRNGTCATSPGRIVVGVLAWQRIRGLRAQPPARVKGERARVFVSALEQAEQLVNAAADVGPAASPLLLFYALSQAGRAIAAARLDDPWRLSGHGLKAPAPGDPSAGLLHRVVKPENGEGSKGRRQAFAGVAEATGSGQLSSALELGAAWAAIPELMPPLPQPPLEDARWIRPLRVYRPMFDAAHMRLADMRPLELLIDGLPDADLDTLLQCLGDYPTAQGAYMWHTLGMRKDVLITQPSAVGMLPVFCWPNVPTNVQLRARHLNGIAPDYRGLGTRLLLPRAGGKDALSPLMLWWLLLFGLSSIARYDPELWIAALNTNNSRLAVPIEAALDAAVEALPELILDALAG